MLVSYTLLCKVKCLGNRSLTLWTWVQGVPSLPPHLLPQLLANVACTATTAMITTGNSFP